MMNLTFLSLTCLSLNLISPFYQVNNLYNTKATVFFYKSQFRYSLTEIIRSQTINHETIIKNTIFSHILSNVLVSKSGEDAATYQKHCYLDNKTPLSPPESGTLVFKNLELNSSNYDTSYLNKRPYFFTQNGVGCGDITVAGCIFKDCYSQDASKFHQYGGALHIEQYCKVILHETIFDKCYTDTKYGGTVFICSVFQTKDNDPSDSFTQYADIQFCCFQNCYCKTKDIAFGVCLYLASTEI